MDEPIEDVYFNWLYAKVARVDVPTPSLTYWTLFRDLHATEFVWVVLGDDNRAEEGLELRREFLVEARLDEDPAWMNIGCSTLEMLIAFARRAAYNTTINARDWFWIFLDNLGLAGLNDAQSRITDKSYEILDHFIWRTYNSDGSGGLFPLRVPREDQRKVELWFQFCEYLIDQDIF